MIAFVHIFFAASLLFVKSVLGVDTTAHTATFPLHHGVSHGKSVWYILTDASDASVAKTRGLDFAPDIANLGAAAIASATQSAGDIVFAGAPDFSPSRTYVASAAGFPPKSATPGGVADAAYSPFVRVAGINGVLNAPIVATGDGPFDVEQHTNTHDRVIAIDTAKHTITLVLARGFIDGKPVYYLSTEASDPVASAVERATYVPRLAKASAAAEIPIGVVVKGPSAPMDAQGLTFLTLDTPIGTDATAANVTTIGSPFNVLSLVPNTKNPYEENGYSPLWNVMAVGAPQTKRITSYAGIAPIAKPAGFAVNCPAIAFGDSAAY
jgi:hypothetical protein